MSVVYTGRSPPRSRTRARLVSACSPDSLSTRSTAAPVRPNSRSTRIPANCSWSAVVREALAWGGRGATGDPPARRLGQQHGQGTGSRASTVRVGS